jgi:hypothetical protein
MRSRGTKPPRDALDALLWVPAWLLPGRYGGWLGWSLRVALLGVASLPWLALLGVLLGWL